MVFGRRPVSIIGLLVATVGAALQNSYQAHLATRIIQGLTTGATESLLPLMITEITFLHQRSQLFSYYWATQTALSSALNLASSYETESLSWRWYYWVNVFTFGFGLVLAFFTAFETRYKRPAVSLSGQVVTTDEFGVTQTLGGEQAAAYLAAEEDEDDVSTRVKKSYLQMISPYSGVAGKPLNIIAKCWWNMIISLKPIGIVYACILATVVLGCALGVSLTYNAALVDYGWRAADVGLINIGGVIGAFLGMAYAGWPADKFNIWLAQRNGGIHKPEHRLLMLPPIGIIGFASLLLYTFTCSVNATWWGPYLGWTLYQYCFVSILIITTAYAAECWPQDPGPALVMAVGGKNIISFGLAYGLVDLLAEVGYVKTVGILAGIHRLFFVIGIPVYYLAPRVSVLILTHSYDLKN
jgi:Major Facilitator Superfamily